MSDRVVRVSVEFENGVVNWIDLDDANEWFDSISQDSLPKKCWSGGRQRLQPGFLDNVFKVIEERLDVPREHILGGSCSYAVSPEALKRAKAFAAYIACYRDPRPTLYNLARYFGFSPYGGLGVEMVKTLLEEAAELRKDRKNLELLYKLLYALQDLDHPARPTEVVIS